MGRPDAQTWATIRRGLRAGLEQPFDLDIGRGQAVVDGGSVWTPAGRHSVMMAWTGLMMNHVQGGHHGSGGRRFGR